MIVMRKINVKTDLFNTFQPKPKYMSGCAIVHITKMLHLQLKFSHNRMI